MKYCLLFSGQSIQERGMCRALWRLPAAREVLERLRPILGDDLEHITTEMSSFELSKTFNAQRAIHAHHLGHWAAFLSAHPDLRLEGAIGHSVGVVAALAAAGAMTFEESAAFIRVRAEAFAAVCSNLAEPHGLASVSSEEFDALFDELRAFPDLQVALHNTATRVVIGGPAAALEKLRGKADLEGWPVRIQLLNVEGPFHTRAFEPSRAALRTALEKLPLRRPEVPVFMGTSGKGETDPERIRGLLVEQAVSTERHLDAVRAAYAAGCRRFLEVSFKPQPIGWLKDQLPSEGVTAWAVPTEAINQVSPPRV
jgi:[acyl-carrier-protein] S-malonyltransferase